MAIDFRVASTLDRPVVGSGTVITDSAHLEPNDDTTDPFDLIAMTMSLSGIPRAPTATSFTKANLASIEWRLTVDDVGTISDLNFFMRDGAANADGYSIEGVRAFTFVVGSPGTELEFAL